MTSFEFRTIHPRIVLRTDFEPFECATFFFRIDTDPNSSKWSEDVNIRFLRIMFARCFVCDVCGLINANALLGFEWKKSANFFQWISCAFQIDDCECMNVISLKGLCFDVSVLHRFTCFFFSQVRWQLAYEILHVRGTESKLTYLIEVHRIFLHKNVF